MLSCARDGPCGYEDKGDISLWLGGKGVYIHTASMTHISCLSEHSLFRSQTRRKPLTEANLTTMTCLMLKATQITATEGFSSILLGNIMWDTVIEHETDLFLVVWVHSNLGIILKQSVVSIKPHVPKNYFPIESLIKQILKITKIHCFNRNFISMNYVLSCCTK